MANIINATDKLELVEPMMYETTREFKTTQLNFKAIFKKCVEEVFFTEYSKSKIMDIVVNKKQIDPCHLNDEETYLMYKLMTGEYNNSERRDVIELFQRLWEESTVFRNRIGGVIKAIDEGKLEQEKLQTFLNYKNPVKIKVAKDYFRFHLNELYNPIRNYILNQIENTYEGRIYMTASPFIYKIEEVDIPSEYRQVMVGESIYELKVN